MGVVRVLGSALLAAFYVAPWMWLLTLGALLAGAIVQFGHFPSYSNPDPRWVVGFAPVHDAAFLLLVPALLSPLVVVAEIVWRVARGGDALTRAPALLAYVLGCALAGAVIFGDAFGLMNWLLD